MPESGASGPVVPTLATPPLRKRRIVHVMYSFGIGGLENVIVQLINGLPADRYDHVVLSLTAVSDFKHRVQRKDVQFIELHKPAGHAFALYPRVYKLLRSLQPDVVHTCNLAALEIVPLAWLARVPVRIHAEHGWDAHDPNGSNPRYQWLRKLYRPFVSHYVAVSKDIASYLQTRVGIAANRISMIANGVDTQVFAPSPGSLKPVAGNPFTAGEHWLVGCVGRLQTVKNQPLLVRAFLRLLAEHPHESGRLRLVIVGEGPLRADIEALLAASGKRDWVWLAGARNDVPDIMKTLDCFALPSQAEGTSCTLQEAMASGLPVVATEVGGTPDLVAGGESGLLVPSDDVQALAEALWRIYSESGLGQALGQMGREIALADFALLEMIRRYDRLFSQAEVLPRRN